MSGIILKETRVASRRKVLKAGSIIFAKGDRLGCTIHNLSTTGASLEISSAGVIPEDFYLSIEMEYRQRHCKVIWRKAKRIGVSFQQDYFVKKLRT